MIEQVKLEAVTVKQVKEAFIALREITGEKSSMPKGTKAKLAEAFMDAAIRACENNVIVPEVATKLYKALRIDNGPAKGKKGTEKGDSKPEKADGTQAKAPGKGEVEMARKRPTRVQVFAQILEEVKGKPMTRTQLAVILDERYSIKLKGRSNLRDEVFWAGNYASLLVELGLMQKANGHEVVYVGSSKAKAERRVV